MKNQISWIRDAGMLLAILLFTGGCLRQVSEPVQQTESEAVPEPASPELLAQTDGDSQTADEENSHMIGGELSDSADISDAAAFAVSDELVVPANVHPGPGMIQVIKLVNSGVDESVLLAYVTNAGERFNLGPEEIIYLNDIGIPGRVITTMLQRDHILQAIAVAPPAWDEPMPLAADESIPPEPDMNPDLAAAPGPGNYVDDAYVQESQPVPPTTAPLFYDALAPYGSWVDVDGYGRCWQPTVIVQQSEWQPYVDNGRWVYTDCGWYWKSDYSWGWAAFHYGRWFRHARLGWCWCPDDVWAPSWVTWRTSDDYCGWAPLPPGCGFNVAGELCWHGRPCAPDFHFGLGWNCFHFVASHDVCDNHVSHRVIPRAKVPRVFHRTVVSNPTSGANRVVSNNGMSRDRIAAASHHEVPRVTLRPTDSSITHATRDRFESNGKVLAVYRPPVGGAFVGRSDGASAGRVQDSSRVSRPDPGRASQTSPTAVASGTGSRPAIRQPVASTTGSTRTVPPLILHGSDFRGNGQTPGVVASSSDGPSESRAANVRGISNLRPGSSPSSGGSSLMIIGHRGGGHDAAQNHGSIKVFSTPAVAHQQQQQWSGDSAVQRGSYTHPYQQQRTPQEQQQPQTRNQSSETVPWWLTRATPSQAPVNRDDNYSVQARPEPRQHFDRAYGAGAEGHQSATQQNQPPHHEAPAAVHSQPSQARSESHSPPPAQPVSAPAPAPAPPPAASSASSSHASAPAQSSSSGSGHR